MRTRMAVVLLVGCVWVGGCCPATHETQRSAGPTMRGAPMMVSAPERAQSAHCLFGVPTKTRDLGPTRTLQRADYTLEHSALDKIPLWVCEHVEPAHIGGAAERTSFKADPDLPKGQRAELADYAGSGYDRGHQAPAADFKYSQDRMDECFYLSNMVPQVGATFNQARWRVLEERVRDCVGARGALYVITGPLFWDPAEDNPATADGIINYFTIGANDVAVPTHLYKIVIAEPSPGQYESVAVVMANEEYPKLRDADYDFTPYLKSIDWIEQHTGLNFMPELDQQNATLATQLEAQPATALWPCLQAHE